MKTELVSIVSHELRTPLASVLGFTALLLKREFDPPTRRHYLGIVDAQARRLGALLEDFLDVQRIEHEGVDLATEQVDLATCSTSRRSCTRPEPEAPARGAARRAAAAVRGDPAGSPRSSATCSRTRSSTRPTGGTVAARRRAQRRRRPVAVHDEGLGIPEDSRAGSSRSSSAATRRDAASRAPASASRLARDRRGARRQHRLRQRSRRGHDLLARAAGRTVSPVRTTPRRGNEQKVGWLLRA
jgi:hypothetical protein